MPNIMLTDACNLRCPYCFANEFVSRDANEISRDAFLRALDFLVGDGSNDAVGLIGGEPTLHSDFGGLLRLALADERVKRVAVFTNGTLLDRYADILTHPKVHMTINCNPPEAIGQERFGRLAANLDLLVGDRLARDAITLGVNIHGADFPYESIVDLAQRHGFKQVRVSLPAPNTDGGRNADAFGYFRSLKPRMLEFFEALLANGIVPNFDCNKMPPCLFTERDKEQLRRCAGDFALRMRLLHSNVLTGRARCRPVVDVLQDLTAVRCFGLSRLTRQRIGDFRGFADLNGYYLRTVDNHAFTTCYNGDCLDCYEREVQLCAGGCLAYKEHAIAEMEDMVRKATAAPFACGRDGTARTCV